MKSILTQLWSIANQPFWLTRREFDWRRDEPSGRATLIRIDHTVRQPDIPQAFGMFVFSYMYYFILGMPLILLMNHSLAIAHWPAVLVLAANCTLRFTVKYHERIAPMVGWPIPVGRESRSVLRIMILVGFTAGVSSGLWGEHLVAKQITPQGVALALLLGMAEAFWNSKRVGGGRAYDQIERPEIEITQQTISFIE